MPFRKAFASRETSKQKPEEDTVASHEDIRGRAFQVYREEFLWRTPLSEGSARWGGMFGTDYIIDPKEETIVLMYVNFQHNGTGVNFKELMHNTAYQALK